MRSARGPGRRLEIPTSPGTQRQSAQSVARLVKRVAARAKIDGDFSSHSLRRGLATSAFDAKEPAERIRTHLRHRSLDTTLGYADEGQALAEHPSLTLLHASKAIEAAESDRLKPSERKEPAMPSGEPPPPNK